MILGFSTKINGKETFFVDKIWKGLKENISEELYHEIILNIPPEEMVKPYVVNTEKFNSVNPKLHTLRDDINDRWHSGIKIDFFINVRKKNMCRFAPPLPVVSTQEVIMTYRYNDLIQISVDGKELFGYHDRLQFALNDGFDNWDDFFNFFYPKILRSKNGIYTAKLIHWTDLKY